MNMTALQEHTAEGLTREIEALYRYDPSLLLVGSMGRSAIYYSLVENPDYEFGIRNESPLISGSTARDIDVVGDPDPPAEVCYPHKLDTNAFHNPLVRLAKEGDDWFLVSDRNKFAEQLHPAVMEPQEGKMVFDIRCLTVNPLTHIELFALNGLMRSKDLVTRQLLIDTLGERPELPPAELFEPFRLLRQINTQSFLTRMRRSYQAVVPENVRMVLYPFTRQLIKKLPF